MIDLGCAGTIALTSPAASKYNLNKVIADKVRYYTKYRGVGGESESYAFVATSIDIGGYKLKHFEAEYSTDQSGSLSSAINAGLLGNKILDRFDVMIDFKTPCLCIKPNDTFSNDFTFSKLGFSSVDRSKTLGAWVVSGFFEHSQAEKSGLRIDDKIIEIDTIPVTRMDHRARQVYLDAADHLMLRVERGTERLNIKIIQNRFLKDE
ncbi:MAG: hypothetical protein KBA26_09890 [Candidatus Delongbacteria bacterium]|nr:hypothetical protein [Candidatus Delongbacteria bacterium]